MDYLDKMIETATDPDVRKSLKYARYLYGDLVTDGNKGLLDEYTETLIEAIRPTAKAERKGRFKSDVAQGFYDYLIREGKTPNTAYDYVKRVERICKDPDISIKIEDLYRRRSVYSINDLIGMYESGNKTDENKDKHNAPLSALKRFEEYMG